MGDTSQFQDAQEVVVRLARPEDRDAVLAFCARTSPDGDYIEYVWDHWIRDERGALLVAVAGERPLGIAHTRMLSEDEAWLEGILVDPRERRQGVGRMLVSRALVASRERGAAVARLFTEADNRAAHALFATFGFTRVAEVRRYYAEALTPDGLLELAQEQTTEPADADLSELVPNPLPPAQTTAVPDDARLTIAAPEEFERIWAWLVQSNLAPLNGGLEFANWTGRALTEPGLRRYLTQERILLLEEWGTIVALAILRDVPARGEEPARLDVTYVDGLSDSIGRLALVLREVAAERGATGVSLWLPNLLILHDAMDGAGYTSDESPMLVYARTL